MKPSDDKAVFEYILSTTSVTVIWEYIYTTQGLSTWFADEVSQNGKIYNFRWGRSENRSAELVNCRNNTYVRFHWVDEEPGSFFEMRIFKNTLTGICTLQITETLGDSTEAELKSLWDSCYDDLKRMGV